jgi:hypothetical protein
MTEPTPAGFIRGFWRWSGAAVLVLAAIVALILGGKQLGWWLQAQDISHQTRNTQNSDSYQRSLVSDMTAKIGTVVNITIQMASVSGQQYADLHAQRLGVAREVCDDAARLSPQTVLGNGLPNWIATNCTAGTLSPSSPLLIKKGSSS